MGFLKPVVADSIRVVMSNDVELFDGESYALRGNWWIASGEKRYGVIHTRPNGWVRSISLNAWASGPAILRLTEIEADFSGDVDNLTFINFPLLNRNRVSENDAVSITRVISGADLGDEYVLNLGDPAGGSFYLHHNAGSVTDNLSWDASAGTVQTALRELYANDNIDVASAIPGVYTITFDPLIGIARLDVNFSLTNATLPSLNRTVVCIDDTGTILSMFPIGRFSLIGNQSSGVDYEYQLNKSYLLEAWNYGESDEDAIVVSLFGVLNEGN